MTATAGTAVRLTGTERDRARAQVWALHNEGLTCPAIVADTGLTMGRVKHLLREARAQWDDRPKRQQPRPSATRELVESVRADGTRAQGGGERTRDNGRADTWFGVQSEVYTGDMPARRPPRFTGWWHLRGDFMIINDVHIPATNWAFAERALLIAQRYLARPRRLIIAGDLINGDALSRWDDLVLGTPLADELAFAEAYLNHLAQHFDEIYFTRGNHENRLLLSLKGQLHAPQFMKMLSDNDRVRFSMYPYCVIESGGQKWRITHQRNYSKLPLRVANTLAAKHHMNIVSAHQHHSAVGRSDCNRYAIIDSGGLHDAELMAYVGLEDSTSPIMNSGFVLLRNGTGTLFTPYENMTDWSQWLPDAELAPRVRRGG